MKKLFFTFLTISFNFLYINLSYSQELQELGPIITSPQAYDFIRYGNIPISHYTGALNLSVPIYSYSDKDFDVNINIRYSSSGFKPAKRPNIVGLDWFLNAGGAITRTVNGIPDEVDNYSPGGQAQNSFSGFSYLANQQPFPSNSFSVSYFSYIDDKFVYDLINYNNNLYELQPDIFNFNFMGYTGKFFYGFDGKIHVVADGNFKVDMSGFSTQYLYQSSNEDNLTNSEIKITDARGYEYTFGGEKKYLEYTMDLGIISTNQDYAYRPVITTWNLRKVKAPNGREIIYDYLNPLPLPPNNDDSSDQPPRPGDFRPQYLFKAWDHYYEVYRFISGNYEPLSQETGTGRKFKVIKTSYISKITIDNDATITFNYTPNTTTFFDFNDFPSRYNQKNLRLNNINIKYKTQDIKNISFTYQDVEPRFFLTEVQEAGKNPYIFEYSETSNLPSPIIKNIDYWGFWNGGYASNIGGVIIPNYTFINGGDLEYTSTERDPNSFSNKAMLTKVIYPTKGFSEIEYELHSYSKRLENKSDNNFYPQLYDVNNLTAGGVRVKRITDYDSSGNSYSREYKYVKNAMTSTNNISSGILNYWPRYIRKAHSRSGGYGGTTGGVVYYYVYEIDYDDMFVSGENLGYFNYNDNYITYSEVAEVFSDGSSKVYKFSSYETNPDKSLINGLDLAQALTFPENLSATMCSVKLDDVSIERGKIKSIDLYTPDHIKVQNTTYHYNENPYRFNNNIRTYLIGFSSFYYAYRIFTYQNNLEKKIVTTYDKNGLNPIVTEEEYQYDLETNLLKKKKSINSKNQEYATYYKYPPDYFTLDNYTTLYDYTAILKTMVDKNMLYPIEVKSTLVDNSTENVTFATLFEYKNEQGNIVKFIEYKLKGLQNSFQDSYFTLIHHNLNSPPDAIFTKMDEYDANVIYHHYDEFGNPTEISKAGGTHIYYIYGYHHTKPIAKIVNFTQTQAHAQNIQTLIDEAIAASDNDVDEASEENLRTELKNLRQALPDNTQVTTYTYDPLVGVTSITDPKGDTQYFEYDNDMKWLKFVKYQKKNRTNKHILKEYEYHYKE